MQRIIFSLTATAVLTLLTSTKSDAKGGAGQGGGHNHQGHPGSSHPQSVHLGKVSPAGIHSQANGSHFAKGPFNQNLYKQYGKQFSHGYCFNLRPYFWSTRCWIPGYGCYGYYCPSSGCYYYWCAPYQCYYPITYCPTGQYVYPEPADLDQEASNP